MKYILNTTWNQLGLRQTLFMFRRACVVLFCWACCVAGATDVHFDLSKFNVNPVGGRTVLLQPLQPIAGNLITNVSDDNGEFTYSNAGRGTNPVDYVVSVRALGAASKIDFQITVLSTNLGTVEADAITSQLGVQTYPTAGKSSWTIQSQEARYQLNGTTLSNTFYPLFSNPSNYAPISFLQATNLALSNQIFVTSNALQIALGAAGISAVTATNIATNQVFLATNGFTSVVYSNGNVFVNTNLLFVTSNALAGQIPAAGISALTSTNIATNQVFLGTNNIGIASSLSAMVSTNRFDVSGVGIAAATAATNAAGIASGLSAYVSTNRFDVAGAATAATNGWPWLASQGFIIPVTNGSSAATIQSALNSATNGGIISIQPGIYTITNTLLITNSIYVEGNGSTLAYATGQTNRMIDTGTNYGKPLIIHNLRFDGGTYIDYNNSNYFHLEQRGAVADVNPYFNSFWTNRTALRVEFSGGVLISDCYFYGWSGNAFIGLSQRGGAQYEYPKLLFQNNHSYSNFMAVLLANSTEDNKGYFNNNTTGEIAALGEYALLSENDFFKNYISIGAAPGNCVVNDNFIDESWIALWIGYSTGNGAHGRYNNNSFNHNNFAIWAARQPALGEFQNNFFGRNGQELQPPNSTNIYYPNGSTSGIHFEDCQGIQFVNNKLSREWLTFTNGCFGIFANNTYGGLNYGFNQGQILGGGDSNIVWGVGIPTNFDATMQVCGNVENLGILNDGSMASILAIATNLPTAGKFAYTPDGTHAAWTSDGSGLTNLSASQLTGSVPQAALPASLLTNNFKGTIMAQGLAIDQWLWQTNAANHTIYQTNTTTGAMLSFSTNGDFSVSSAAGVVNLSVANTGATVMRSAGFSTYAAQSGKSNVVFIDNLGFIRTNDMAGFVQSIIAGTAGGVPPLTNAYGTNLPNGLVVAQRIYFPTNDFLGASNVLATANATASNFNATANSASSNLLAANKMNGTNGFSTGQTASNLVIQGSIGFGRDGTDTNIISTTNVVGFYLAGTSLATNGAFIWNSSLGCYTNWVTSAILTNNSTAWLMQTNGVSLYSLAGASPFGVYTAVGGTGTPLGVPGFVLDHNRMVDVGFISATNINYQITNAIAVATNNLNVLITNGTLTGSIATSNGFGTNTTLRFGLAAWGIGNTAGGAYSASLAGLSNNVSAAGSAVVGGIGNSATGVAGYNFIGGGLGNAISAGAAVIGGGTSNFIDLNNNNSFIGGGSSNRIENNNALSASILGGNYNKIAFGSISGGANYAVILGGQFNTNKGAYSIIGGHNFTASNDNVFGWSDGTVAISKTNSQMYASATNGLYVDGPIWHGFNSTNGGAYFISNTVSTAFSIYAVTNSMPNFSYWMGESNGIMVMIYYSNNVSFMKNMWP